MKTKVLLAVLATTVVGFILGWLIFGIALADFYKNNTTFYQGLEKNPPFFFGFFLGSLFLGILIVYIFDRWAKIDNFMSGLYQGFIIYFLIILSFDIFMYSSMNLFTVSLVIVDVIANSFLGGIVGGVAGLILGSGKKAAMPG
jgi:hypothetical protein